MAPAPRRAHGSLPCSPASSTPAGSAATHRGAIFRLPSPTGVPVGPSPPYPGKGCERLRLEQALQGYGAPDIFNSDQGCQFTSEVFTAVLQGQGIAISRDGRGRALDNIFVERLWRSVKYEDVYLKGYADVPELLLGLTDYFVFYNTERSHQSLDYRTPDEVYRAGHGGGARIVDKFSERETSRTEAEAISGQRRSAACDPLPS